MMHDPGVRSWFAIQVTPRHEQKVATMLDYRGCTQFLPLRRVDHRWSDRSKAILEPLFPNYIFCHIVRSEFGTVLSTPGVWRIVGFGGKPYPVADEEIQALQRIVGSGLNAMPLKSLKKGQKVRIEQGPLEGIVGVLTEIRNQQCLVVTVQMIMHSVAVTVGAWMVAKVDDPENREQMLN
jgi:transcription antitermination factor NusG